MGKILGSSHEILGPSFPYRGDMDLVCKLFSCREDIDLVCKLFPYRASRVENMQRLVGPS